MKKILPKIQDLFLILFVMIIAGCGVIYQYLLAHYAGRMLGVMEHTIFTVIGIMIVAMGIGSFLAKTIKNNYDSFVILELFIGLIGAISIFIIGYVFALYSTIPDAINNIYNVYIVSLISPVILEKIVKSMPFIIASIQGILIGMEIPIIARIREDIYQKHLKHNVGTIYGIDYIGAGIGSAIFIIYMLTISPALASVITAIVNLIVSLLFLLLFWSYLKYKNIVIFFNLIALIFCIYLWSNTDKINNNITNILYYDNVKLNYNTQYQNIILTEDKRQNMKLYLNGRLQFDSNDEYIYHEMLVHPIMMASNHNKNILIIGGGDGLAVREVLKWNPNKITLIDIDQEMIDLFQNKNPKIPISEKLLQLNQKSLQNKKLKIIINDAFIAVKKLEEKFDIVIIDLPDPSHPDLNKLYSLEFYLSLNKIINADGLIAIQSTSPFHAKQAFLTVGETLKKAQFSHVDRYQEYIPSFGQWGWSIAVKQGISALNRINKSNKKLPNNVRWVTKNKIQSSFVFEKDFYKDIDIIKANTLDNQEIYLQHYKAWNNLK